MGSSDETTSSTKKTKITKKEKLAMMNLNVALASKSHHHQNRLKTFSHKAKSLAVSTLIKQNGKSLACKKSSTTSTPTATSSSSPSSSPPSSSSSPSSGNVSSSSVDETINCVVKSISKGEERKTSKPKVAKPPKSPGLGKESKGSKSSTNAAIPQSAKDGDSIDETIESVLNQINSIDVASCEDNSQVDQVTCVKSEVGKKINPLNESKSGTTTTINSSSMGKDVKASTSGQTGVSEKKKKITVLYEEDIVDGFAIHSFLTYNDLKVSALLPFFSVFFLSSSWSQLHQSEGSV